MQQSHHKCSGRGGGGEEGMYLLNSSELTKSLSIKSLSMPLPKMAVMTGADLLSKVALAFIACAVVTFLQVSNEGWSAVQVQEK